MQKVDLKIDSRRALAAKRKREKLDQNSLFSLSISSTQQDLFTKDQSKSLNFFYIHEFFRLKSPPKKLSPLLNAKENMYIEGGFRVPNFVEDG